MSEAQAAGPDTAGIPGTSEGDPTLGTGSGGSGGTAHPGQRGSETGESGVPGSGSAGGTDAGAAPNVLAAVGVVPAVAAPISSGPASSSSVIDAEEVGDKAPGDAAADEDFDEDDADLDDDDDDDEGDQDEDDAADAEAAGDGEGTGRTGGRSSRVKRGAESLRQLEEEGEVAADYLEELLDIVDLDGDIDIDVENGRASVAVVAEGAADRELRKLVGPRGEVLEALQELSRLAVQARTGDRSRLMLDVAGFRAARRRALEDVGARACQEVQRSGAPVRLEPMTAFERKVVHDVVADAGLVSESEGEEPNRRVVVFPSAP